MPSFLVTGASRGLGLAFVTELVCFPEEINAEHVALTSLKAEKSLQLCGRDCKESHRVKRSPESSTVAQ